jgi:hypothetical protein
MVSSNFDDNEKHEDNEIQAPKEIKKFLVLFLRIIDSILVSSSTILNKNGNETVLVSNHQLQELCQICLQEFNSCLFYTKKFSDNHFARTNNDDDNESKNNNGKLFYLSDELIFKLTMTILMTIEHMKNKRSNANANKSSVPEESNSAANKTNLYFTSVAFALVFFSHLINHVVIRLEEG